MSLLRMCLFPPDGGIEVNAGKEKRVGNDLKELREIPVVLCPVVLPRTNPAVFKADQRMQKAHAGFPITLRRAERTGADGKEREFLLAVEKESGATSLDPDLRSARRFRPQRIQMRENALIDRGSHVLELQERAED